MDILVTVTLGDDGEEEAAGFHLPRIDVEIANQERRRSLEDRSPGFFRDLVQPQLGHGQFDPIFLRMSRITSPSLKGMIRSFRT